MLNYCNSPLGLPQLLCHHVDLAKPHLRLNAVLCLLRTCNFATESNQENTLPCSIVFMTSDCKWALDASRQSYYISRVHVTPPLPHSSLLLFPSFFLLNSVASPSQSSGSADDHFCPLLGEQLGSRKPGQHMEKTGRAKLGPESLWPPRLVHLLSSLQYLVYHCHILSH